MAYITTEQVAVMRAKLKAFMPTKDGWKFSLRVKDNSVVVFNLIRGPKKLEIFKYDEADYKETQAKRRNAVYGTEDLTWTNIFGTMDFDGTFPEETANFLIKIMAVLNTGNYDNSEPMTDYFDVGYYVRASVGDWQTPYEFKPK